MFEGHAPFFTILHYSLDGHACHVYKVMHVQGPNPDWVLVVTRVKVLTETIRFMCGSSCGSWTSAWLAPGFKVRHGLDTMWHKWHERKIPNWVLDIADWSKTAPSKRRNEVLGGCTGKQGSLGWQERGWDVIGAVSETCSITATRILFGGGSVVLAG